MSVSASRTRSLLLIGAFAIIYIGWGTTYLANHFLLLEVPPFVIGSLRFSIAGLLALAWVLLSGQLRIQRSDWGSVLIGSLALMDVFGRVARLLLETAEVVDGEKVVTRKLSKQDIARMIGASLSIERRKKGGTLVSCQMETEPVVCEKACG